MRPVLKSQTPNDPSPRRATRSVTADVAAIAEAARLLRAGGLVAFPTETVYGLAADATSDAAVATIYAAKGRPHFNPLIAHVADRQAARRQAVFTPEAEALAEAFWPGPLTLVLPVAADASVGSLARAGLDSIGLRVPAHPVALSLLAETGRPLAAPSANISGHVSPVTAAHVAADLDGRIDLILDAGACGVGLESTIISLIGPEPVLLRPGGLPRAAVEEVLSRPLATAVEAGDTPLAPGQLVSHYAPRARLRLGAHAVAADEAGLDFGGTFPKSDHILDLSPRRDLTEAAGNLFHHLRALDLFGMPRIAVAPIPEQDLGEAINDRLRRAAAERPVEG